MGNRKFLARLGDRRRNSWHLDAAVVAPVTNLAPNVAPTGAGSGFSRSTAYVITQDNFGDFPAEHWEDINGLILTNGNWGNAGGGTNDNVGGIWISLAASIAAPVQYAEFRFGVQSFTGTPTFRVHAVKAKAPNQPVMGYVSDGPIATYSSPGWTTAYAEFKVTASGDGQRVDVTDIVNELVSALGETGAAIMFTFYCTDALAVAGTMNIKGQAYLPRLITYASLNHRDYQRAALNGMTAAFYWPFDADDSRQAGLQTYHRAVVAPSLGAAGVDVVDSQAAIQSALVAVPTRYGATGGMPSELERGGYVRQFLGPAIDTSDPDKFNNMYGWSYSGVTREVLMVLQLSRTAGKSSQVLLDSYGDTAFFMEINEAAGSNQVKIRASWAGLDYPYPGHMITITDAAIFAPGAVVTYAIWYDKTLNLFKVGYTTGGAWAWDSSIADTGGLAGDISGLQWVMSADGNVCQGWAMLDVSTSPASFAIVESACTRARALWAAGVKALPPILYA